MASGTHAKARVSEKVIQAQGVKLLRMVGARVYVTGTTRPKGDYQGTCMTPGLADVLAFVPVAGDRSTYRLLCWEAKAEGGRMSPAQVQFRADCAAAQVPHVVGDLDALIEWLLTAQLLKAEHVPHHRLPATGARS